MVPKDGGSTEVIRTKLVAERLLIYKHICIWFCVSATVGARELSSRLGVPKRSFLAHSPLLCRMLQVRQVLEKETLLQPS